LEMLDAQEVDNTRQDQTASIDELQSLSTTGAEAIQELPTSSMDAQPPTDVSALPVEGRWNFVTQSTLVGFFEYDAPRLTPIVVHLSGITPDPAAKAERVILAGLSVILDIPFC
jgi:hypothetical protein